MIDFYIKGYNIFLILLVTFLTSVILTPLVRKLAIHLEAIDKPDHKRKIHNKNMPLMGGLSIFASFLLGYMLFAPKTTQMLSVLIGGFIIILIGIFDDIKPLSAGIRFVIELIAAAIVVYYGNFTFANMHIFGMKFSFGILAKPIAIIFIVGITNAFNLADGLDGLATGTATIYFITIAIIGFIMTKLGGLDVILCLIMAGACLGFLVHNFAPATIYLGSTGSTFLGFIISIIALLGFKTATITSLIIPLLVLFVPLSDTILAIFRRIIKGESPFNHSDKQHIHHQILKSTKSPRKAVLLMYLINALFASISVLYTLGNKKLSIFIYCILLLSTLMIVLKTDVLFEHQKKDKSNEN